VLKHTLAAELLGSSASRLHQNSLPSSGTALHGKAGQCLIRRTAVVRTRMPVVWEGRHREMSPYPGTRPPGRAGRQRGTLDCPGDRASRNSAPAAGRFPRRDRPAGSAPIRAMPQIETEKARRRFSRFAAIAINPFSTMSPADLCQLRRWRGRSLPGRRDGLPLACALRDIVGRTDFALRAGARPVVRCRPRRRVGDPMLRSWYSELSPENAGWFAGDHELKLIHTRGERSWQTS
jgi:hypothetical protein